MGPLLLLFDRATGAVRTRVDLPGTAGDIWPVGPLLMTTIGDSPTAVFVDPMSERIVGDLSLPFVGDVVVNPAGTALVVFAAGRAALVAIPDGRVIREFSGATRAAAAAAFSADGTLVAVGGEDQLIGVWDVNTGELRDTLRGHAAPVHGLVFSADGRTLYSASQDNSVIAWDVAGADSFASRRSRAPILPAPTTTDPGLTFVATPTANWSGDRRRVHVQAGDASAAALIDVARAGRSVRIPPSRRARHGSGCWLSISTVRRHSARPRRTRWCASTCVTGAVISSPPVQPPLQHGSVGLSGDGRVLTVETLREDADGTIHPVDITVHDPATLAVRQRLPVPDHWVWSSWLNHDGSLLVTTHDSDNHVELWDTRTGHRRWRVDIGYSGGQAFALSPNGRTLVIGTFDGAVVLLDLATGRVLARHSLRLSAEIGSADFSPDGAVIAVGGDDGQVHLLTADTLREIGQLPIGTGGSWAFAAYTANGSTLSAVDERGRIVHWDPRPTSWIRRACSIAARDLTAAEWNTYLPDVAHQRTCPTR